MTRKIKASCRHCEECEAPLCPLDEASLEGGIWFPGEEICKDKRFQSFPWIQAQKQIKDDDSSKFFTKETLMSGSEGKNICSASAKMLFSR